MHACAWYPVVTEGLNYNTLYQPLEFQDLTSDPALDALLRGLLERDAAHRLGAAKGAAEVRGSPFFQSVEWELLVAQRLPAPWRPDANIVYAKDYITPLSVDEPEIEQQNASASRTPQLDSPLPAPGTPLSLLQMQAPAALGESGTAESWNYVCDQAAFAEELAEYAMKASAIERQQKRHRWRPRFLG